MLTDVLHLMRNLRRSPTSAAASVLTLSLTIGAGTAIFAVVDAVLLTPPPFSNPDALVALGETPVDDAAATARSVTYATFESWRERAAPRASLEAFDGTNVTMTGVGSAERVSATDVTPGFFTLLGVAPARGRIFGANDLGQPVAIVSDTFWRSTLASDPGVIGRQLVLGSQPHTIVGVLPPQFFFAFNASDIWRPLRRLRVPEARAGMRVRAIARLAPGVTPEGLTQTLDEVSRASSPSARVVATPIAMAIAGDASATIRLLAGAGAVAMLVAFTNLAGLLIVRAIDRRRELALRSALGAKPAEIVRQLLLEAQVLVIAGTISGVLLAWWLTPAVGDLMSEQFGAITSGELAVNWRVIGVMSVIASACAWMCGLLPALLASRWSIVDLMRRGATAPPRELVLRRLFVSGVMALALVLLVSVTLLARSLLHVLEVNPGFTADGVLTMQISLPEAKYSTPRHVAAFYESLQRVLDERLGVRAAAIVDELPLTGDRGRSLVSLRSSEVGRESVMRVAGRSYFDVMRIPIIDGRSFDAGDTESAPARVVVSRSLAETLFANESAIGRRVWLSALARDVEVVGVSGDIAHRSLDDPIVSTVYLAASQWPSRSCVLVARSAGPNSDVIAATRDAVARLDADLPVYRVRTMSDVVAASPGVPARRVLTATFTGFAVLAVVLGAIGLFGVIAHDVASRRPELALRIALGAKPMQIVTATLRQAAVIVGSGLVVGGVLAVWAARALGGMVAMGRDNVLASVALPVVTLTIVGLIAALPVARRASRTDPLTALRSN